MALRGRMADESVVLSLNNCIGLKQDRKSNPPPKPTRISNPPYNMRLIHPGNNKTTTTFLAISNPLKNTNLETTKTFVWVMGRICRFTLFPQQKKQQTISNSRQTNSRQPTTNIPTTNNQPTTNNEHQSRNVIRGSRVQCCSRTCAFMT